MPRAFDEGHQRGPMQAAVQRRDQGYLPEVRRPATDDRRISGPIWVEDTTPPQASTGCCPLFQRNPRTYLPNRGGDRIPKTICEESGSTVHISGSRWRALE